MTAKKSNVSRALCKAKWKPEIFVVRSSETHECRDRQVNLANQADGPRDRVELTVQVLGPGLTGSRISAVDLSRRAKSKKFRVRRMDAPPISKERLGVMVTNFPLSAALLDRPARFAEVILFAFRKVPGCFFGGTDFGG